MKINRELDKFLQIEDEELTNCNKIYNEKLLESFHRFVSRKLEQGSFSRYVRYYGHLAEKKEILEAIVKKLSL